MDTNRMVVVTTPLTLVHHRKREVVAARFRELGLTAYGRTEFEAVLALKRLFNKFVHTYRESGQIEARLEQVGVRWYWADEYPDTLPPFEDTNELLETAPSLPEIAEAQRPSAAFGHLRSWADIAKITEAQRDQHQYQVAA